MTSVFLQTRTVRAVVSVFAFAILAFSSVSAQAASYADHSIVLTGPTSVESTQSTVQYNIAVRNAGPALSNGMSFTASFPSTVVSITSLEGNQPSLCTKNAKNIRCSFVGAPPLSTDQRFVVTVDVSSIMGKICSAKTQKPQLSTAKVTKPVGRVIDPQLSNNTSQSQFSVLCPPKLSGNLFITSSATTYAPKQLLGGTLGDPILSIDMFADTESVNVTKVRLSLPAVSLRSLDRIELYKLGANNPFASATVASCGMDAVPEGTVCAQIPARLLVVQKGKTLTVVARPRLRSDVVGAVSGDLITLSVLSVDARGDTTKIDLVKNDGDNTLEGEVILGRKVAGTDLPPESAKNIVVLSKLVSITNANPDADGSAVPAGTARSIGQFKFSALSSSNTHNGLNRFTLDRAIFTVDLANVGVDPASFKLYNKTDISLKSSCAVDPASTATKLFVDCTSLASSSVNTRLDPGSNATFVLEATITNPQIVMTTASSIQVSLEQYNDASKIDVSPSMSHIRWLDVDAGSQTPFTWIENAMGVVYSTKYGNPVVAQSRKLGDVNNDGKLSSADTTLMRRHFEGIITLTGEDFTAGDVDQDGLINVSDFYLERGAIVQMITLPAVYGDVTGDGKVTSADTALIAEFVSGAKTPSNRQKYLGDVNVDGILNQKDVDFTAQAVLKLVILPVLCGNSILNVDAKEQCDDGNSTTGDGCDLMCRIDVVTQNELTIVHKAMASSDSAVRNQKDLPLLRFEAKADNEGILLTELKFDLAQGSFLNATNYTLKVDTNADGVVDTTLQSGALPLNGVLIFDSFVGAGYSLPSMQAVIFEVRADIASSTVSNLLQLKFATTVPSYVAADRIANPSHLSGIKTDGTCAVTCEITVVTNISTLWNISSQGNLFITQSSTPVRSRQLLGGALSDDILRLSLRSDSEDIDVTNLVFTAVGSDASTFSQNVSRLELTQVGSTTPFAVASIAGCGADPVPAYSMCAVMNGMELTVPKGSNIELLVRARMKSDLDGAVSGKKLAVSIDAEQGAKARGLASNNFLSPNNGDTLATGETFIGVSSAGTSQTIVGKDHVAVMSKVISITNADPNANGTMIPSGSNRAISQLKFTTASHANFNNGMNKVVIDTVIYTVNATNVALDPSAFKIYNKVDSSMKASCSLDPASTASLQYVVCPNLPTSDVNTQLDPGSDSTFVLEANVLNAQVNPLLSSSLQVSLQNFSNSALTTLSVAGSHVRWLDKDNASSTPFLWIESPETVINGTSYQS